jgi:hypothetical protein
MLVAYATLTTKTLTICDLLTIHFNKLIKWQPKIELIAKPNWTNAHDRAHQ